MKKIMFMINSLNGGGAEKVLQTLLNSLDYNRYDVTVYSMHREEIENLNYPKQVHYKVVFDEYNGQNFWKKETHKIFSKIKGKVFQLCSSKIFYKLFIHEKYDIEIAFIEGESTKIIAGSPNENSKKYAWVHIDLEENPWTSFLYDSITDEGNHYEKFDRILCVSKSVREAFLDKFKNVEKSKVYVQYNPIDRDSILKLSKVGEDIEKTEKLRMVAVGRLVEQKGFDRLIEICNWLRNDNYSFELLILGEGDKRKELENMIMKLQLEKYVKLVGFVENPYPIMSIADILVCSSRSEGFSTVLTEGVVLGLPIISTECAGVRELFSQSKCGMIADNDTNALYEALKKVLDNPEMLISYRKESKERGKYFELKNTMKDINKLLDM